MWSFGDDGFIHVHPGGRWVHLVSLGSFGCALGVVGFIRGSSGALLALDSFWCALSVVGYIRCRCIHSGAPRGSFGSFRFVGFIRVRPGGGWFHLGVSWGSFGSFEVVSFIRVCPGCSWIHTGLLGSFVQPGGRLVHSVSLESFECALGVVVFTRGCWFHSGAPCGYLGAFGVTHFIRVRPGIVVGFIRVHSLHACVPRGPLGSCGFVGFIRVRAVG